MGADLDQTSELKRHFAPLRPRREGHPGSFDAELNVQAERILTISAVLCLLAWTPYFWTDQQLHPELPALPWLRAVLVVTGAVVLLLRLLPAKVPKPSASNLLALLGVALVVTTGVITGLTDADPTYVGGYLLVIMVVPAAPLDRRVGWALLGGSLAAFLATGGAEGLDLSSARGRYSANDLLVAVVVSGVFTHLGHRLRRRSWEKSVEIERQRDKLRNDKERIDELLLNILPKAIADELKSYNFVRPRHYETATIVFTDFVGFTAMAARMTPEDLLDELHGCFSKFDRLMDEHGLEKLKTIGDAYMFAGGVPDPSPTHAIDAVLAALRIRDCIAELRSAAEADGRQMWDVRIGVHTGPLIAGIVGEKKFVYDVWGDSVNLAARMESSGSPGEVNVSRAVKERVEAFFELEPRGARQVKGKGDIEMFTVIGLRPEMTDARPAAKGAGGATGGSKPNRKFRERYEQIARR